MNFKSFAAGVAVGTAVGIATKQLSDVVHHNIEYMQELNEMMEEGSEMDELIRRMDESSSNSASSSSSSSSSSSEFAEEPPDEWVGQEEITPEDIFDNMMGEGGFIDTISEIEEEANEIRRKQIIDALESGPKDWDDLKLKAFGQLQNSGLLDGPFNAEEAINQALDETLTEMQQDNTIRQRDDNLYELVDDE